MKIAQEISYQVGSHFMSALINDDESGLEDDEIELLNSFVQSLSSKHHSKVFTTSNEPYADEDEFALCEITNLYSSCSKLIVLIYS
jgi:hypothetical protein